MNVFFRVDASIEMGSGHLMRCLTLAEQLKEKGVDVSFISRNHEGNLFNLIIEKGFKLYQLPRVGTNKIKPQTQHSQWLGVNWDVDVNETIEILKNNLKPDWLIIDHYAIDEAWEKQVRPFVKNIMVIDDLADRPHDCDILLDQNYYLNMKERYRGLIPSTCQTLLGPQFVLLRPEFIKAREKLRKRNGDIKKIFVFFGGTDPTNETKKALAAIKRINKSDITADVVVGASNPHKKDIESYCNSNMMNATYYCQTDKIAELMAKADLAIGGGGTTTWERCYMGLPAIVVSLADNQIETNEILAQKRIIKYLGKAEEISEDIWYRNINELMSCPDYVSELSKNALNLMDNSLNNILVELLRGTK